MTDLIPIAEYAARVSRAVSSVRQKCQRGTLPGAVKLGRDWFIPPDAPYPDERIRSGKYLGARRSDSSASPSDFPD